MARVQLDHGGMNALLNSEAVRKVVTSEAQQVLSSMEALAPVESGDLRASLHIIQGTTDRVAVHVGSDLPYALYIAIRRGFMARALDGAGGA